MVVGICRKQAILFLVWRGEGRGARDDRRWGEGGGGGNRKEKHAKIMFGAA